MLVTLSISTMVFRMMEAVCAEDCAPLLRDLCLQLLANVTRVQVKYNE